MVSAWSISQAANQMRAMRPRIWTTIVKAAYARLGWARPLHHHVDGVVMRRLEG